MADVAITEQLAVANVEEKSFPKKDRSTGQPTGEMGKLWNIAFVGGKYPASTFSENCAQACRDLMGKQATFHLSLGKVFQNVQQYGIERIMDGPKVLYEPDAKKPYGGGGGKGGGYSRPDWTYMTPLERLDERLSIEGQKSLDLAVQVFSRRIEFDGALNDEDAALKFIEKAQPRFARLIRKSVAEQSGPGNRPSWVGDGAGVSRKAEANVSKSEASAAPSRPSTPARVEPRGDHLPSPGPDSSPTNGGDPEIEAKLTTLDDITGGRTKTLLLYKKQLNRPPIPGQMTITDDELNHLLAIAAQEMLNA